MASVLQKKRTSPPETPPLSWRRCLAEVALIFLVFLIFGGASAPHNNEPHYLCRLKHFWNPAWCPGDLFLDSPDAHLVFVYAFGWVTKWLSLPATAWLGRVICWLGLAWAWQRMSWRVVSTPLASVLSAGLFVALIRKGHLAGEWVVGGVEAKCVAYIFVFLALAALVDGRWKWVWIWLGGATAFHALVGGWSGVVCCAIWLLDGRKETSFRETTFRQMLPGLALGTLIGLPGVVPALQLSAGQSPEVVAEANRIYVFERLPHHLALLSVPVAEIAQRFFRHGLLILSLAAMGALVTRIDLSPSTQRKLKLLRWFAWGAVCIAVLGVVLELAFWNHPLVAAKFLKYYWFRLTDVAVPLAVGIQVAAMVAAGIAQRKAWGAVALLLALAFGGWQVVDVCSTRNANPVPPADRKMHDYAAWVDACDWIAANTPEESLFLTPRAATSFKWRTGRPEVVTRKDIPQDAASMVQWFQRLCDIHNRQVGDKTKVYWSLGHQGTARIEHLAQKYQFDYVLTDNRRRLGLPIVYRNKTYVLYALRQE